MARLIKRLASWILREEIELWRTRFNEMNSHIRDMHTDKQTLLSANKSLSDHIRGEDHVPLKRTIH